jgi:hypothetical protein
LLLSASGHVFDPGTLRIPNRSVHPLARRFVMLLEFGPQ